MSHEERINRFISLGAKAWNALKPIDVMYRDSPLEIVLDSRQQRGLQGANYRDWKNGDLLVLHFRKANLNLILNSTGSQCS